jgi:Flp pilus assembly protein TadD
MQNDPAALDALIQQGLAASQANRVDEALDLFRRASEQVPSSGLPHFLIGAELAQLGRMDEAEAAYANAVLLAPDLLMARYQLGLIQFTSGRPALALVTWGPLFQLPPENVLQHVVRGFAALAQDDFDEATSRFREGITLNHDNPALNNDLQMMLDRIATARNTASASPDAVPTPAAPTAPAAEPASAEAEAEADNLHVLLSNYQRQGPLH